MGSSHSITRCGFSSNSAAISGESVSISNLVFFPILELMAAASRRPSAGPGSESSDPASRGRVTGESGVK